MILTREKDMTTTSPDRLDRIESLLIGLGEDMSTVKEDLGTVKTELRTVKSDLNSVKQDLSSVKTDLTSLKEQTTKTNEKVETYQKASQQVVNLAFGMIVTAALAVILPVVTNR